MKLSHFTSIIVILFAVVFWISTILSQNTVASSTSNKDYSMIITNACLDAIKTIDVNETRVFKDESSRKEALRVFYKTILKGLDIDNGINDKYISEKTPFVLLLDTDGYYLNYNTAFDTEMTVGETDSLCACTGLNTWADTYVGIDGRRYQVRFFLNDYIEVVDESGKKTYGSLKEVSKSIPALDFISDNKRYEENKRYCVINCMEDTINYLLNTQNINTGSWRMGYSVSLSMIPGEDWTRMIKNPTIIGFLQGPNKNNMEDNLNVFGFASSEKLKGQLYYAEDELFYRLKTDEVPETLIEINGEEVTIHQTHENIGNMKTLAGKGNNPDITAYRNQ